MKSRKLAERSAIATREIGSLVKMIQKTVTDAVTAMDEGSAEVENGVTKANKAGAALQAIQKATEAVTEQARLASAAAERMETSANTLVGAVDSVSAVVEENTAATEQMAASAMEVSQSIENIASVSRRKLGGGGRSLRLGRRNGIAGAGSLHLCAAVGQPGGLVARSRSPFQINAINTNCRYGWEK